MHRNCNGQYFLLPNRIFDERLSPNEFIVYSFLVRAKDSAGQSFWSVPMIAKSCSMCASTCRKVLRSLESGGYITISKRFIGGEQKSNLYTVNKIQCTVLYGLSTKNMKGFDLEILLFLKRKSAAFEWILKRNSSRRF